MAVPQGGTGHRILFCGGMAHTEFEAHLQRSFVVLLDVLRPELHQLTPLKTRQCLYPNLNRVELLALHPNAPGQAHWEQRSRCLLHWSLEALPRSSVAR